jgi:dienelactone hydrolase
VNSSFDHQLRLAQTFRSRPLWSCLFAFTVGLSSCTNAPSSNDELTQASETTQSETQQDESESSAELGTESETGEIDPIDYELAGPHPVGNLFFELADPARLRPLRVELWYPASEAARAAAESGQALSDFVPDEPDASTFVALIDVAPDECVRKNSKSAAAPELASIAGPWPTIVFSHCHGCARFSTFSVAERLASHGFLVAAVDHAGSTLFDEPLAALDQATLELRRDDVVRVIDELLDPSATSLPSEFVGLADAERVGVFGHSFGSITTGLVLQDDPRPRAGVAIAAPIENPLLPGVTMAAIAEPLLLVVAVEDNSITEFGNMAIRTNFGMANTPVWKIEFADTGHFGFSDLAGVSEYFAAGCGDGERQTNGEPFTYADPFTVRGLLATRATAFFALHLLGDEDARAQLEAEDPLLDIQVRD